MDVSTADFAEIQELQQFRRLYEEQAEKSKVRLGEKDEHIADMEKAIGVRDQELQNLDAQLDEIRQEAERMRNDYVRLRDESQQSINQLMGRARELKERLESHR